MPWQCSGYISGSKNVRILTMVGFWITKRNPGFKICLNMAENDVIMHEYVWIYNNRDGSEYFPYNR